MERAYTKDSGQDSVVEEILAWCLCGFPASFFQEKHCLKLLLDFLATQSILRLSMEICA